MANEHRAALHLPDRLCARDYLVLDRSLADVMGRVSPLAAYLILVAIVALGIFRVEFFLARDGDQAHDALCAFKVDLERRVADTERFIVDLAEGRRRPIPGITIADLERSSAGQRSTLDSLTSLDC